MRDHPGTGSYPLRYQHQPSFKAFYYGGSKSGGGVVIWGTCIGREGGIPSRYNRRVFRERYKYNERAIKV